VRTSENQLFCCKSIDKLISEAEDPERKLKKTLGPWSLTALGIGAIIGSGIFVLTGHAAATNAGPAIILSFVLGAVVCALAGLCYAEMASTVPVSGSAVRRDLVAHWEFLSPPVRGGLALRVVVLGAESTGTTSPKIRNPSGSRNGTW